MEDLIDNRQMNDYSPSNLPNATAVLVLGIISIAGCIGYGVPGLICGIIALALHRKNVEMYKANPEKYKNSYQTARAGFICAVVGTSLSLIFILFIIIMIGVISTSRF